MEGNEISSLGDLELYCTSFYYTISTITTVGYGDLSAANVLERAISIIIMIIILFTTIHLPTMGRIQPVTMQ